jgi:hypothetical protein
MVSIFSCVCWPFVSLLLWTVCSAHLSTYSVGPWVFERLVSWAPVYSGSWSFVRCAAGKGFPPLCRLPLHSGDCFLCCAFSFIQPHLSLVPLIAELLEFFSQSCDLCLCGPVCSLLFSGSMSDLTWRFLNHSELTRVQGERLGSSFRLPQVETQFWQHRLSKRLSFLQHIFWSALIFAIFLLLLLWDLAFSYFSRSSRLSVGLFEIFLCF